MKNTKNNQQTIKPTILQEAQSLVYGDREKDYGSVTKNFGRIAQLWGAILDCEVTAEQVGLCMIGVKMARQCHKPKRDSHRCKIWPIPERQKAHVSSLLAESTYETCGGPFARRRRDPRCLRVRRGSSRLDSIRLERRRRIHLYCMGALERQAAPDSARLHRRSINAYQIIS